MAFLTSKIAALLIQVCPHLNRQRIQQPPSPPQPAIASTDIGRQPVWLRSASPSSPQPQLASQLPHLLAVQNHHQRWQNAVIAFCFSYALGVSLRFSSTDQSNYDQLPFPFVLLSFLILITFIFTLVAFFLPQTSTIISQALQKVVLIFAAAAFNHTLSIPFSFELKCTIWALFFLCLLIAIIFTYLNTNNI